MLNASRIVSESVLITLTFPEDKFSVSKWGAFTVLFDELLEDLLVAIRLDEYDESPSYRFLLLKGSLIDEFSHLD